MPRYFEFEITLQEIEPRIWRRLLVRTTSTFADLHRAIQDSFGWLNYHLFEFRLARPNHVVLAGCPVRDGWAESGPNATYVKLNTYFHGGYRTEWCEYVYDFGDDWVHEVKLIGVHSDKATFKRRLLGGARACPPEDCGGLPGYERAVHCVETGEDSMGEEAGVLADWLGDWRPEVFDLQAAKAAFDR